MDVPVSRSKFPDALPDRFPLIKFSMSTRNMKLHLLEPFVMSEAEAMADQQVFPIAGNATSANRGWEQPQTLQPISLSCSLPSSINRASTVVTSHRENDPALSLSIGSMVQISDSSRYGVLRWSGNLSEVPGTIAGVEMEEGMDGCTDGSWNGKKYFNCKPGRGFFCPLSSLRPDDRLVCPIHEEIPGARAKSNSLPLNGHQSEQDLQTQLLSWKVEKDLQIKLQQTEQDLQTQLRQSQQKEQDLQRQLQQKEQDLQRQLAQSQQTERYLRTLLALSQKVEQNLQMKLQQTGQDLQRQLTQSQLAEQNLQTQLQPSQQTEQDHQRQLAQSRQTEQDHQRQLAQSRQTEQDLKRQLAQSRQTEQDFQRQLAQSRQTEQDHQRQLAQSQQTEQDLKRQLAQSQQTEQDHQRQLAQSQQTEQDLQTQLQQSQQTEQDLQRQLAQSQQTEQDLKRQLAQSQQTEQDLQKQLAQSRQTEQDHQRQLAQSQQTEQDLKRQLAQSRQTEQDLQRQLAQSQQTEQDLQRQLAQSQQTEQYLKRQLQLTTKAMQDLQLQSHSQASSRELEFWNVPRSDIQVVSEIGRGGWGTVLKGTFQGRAIAVKQLHPAILSNDNVQRLRREVRMMAQIRHPNLLLFIAAVFDDEVERLRSPPLIIMELLDTDLRKAYKTKLILSRDRIPIFRDVAFALNYLHNCREPIIHRDLSAPNVLLEALSNNRWKAKISDFGSANLVKFAQTAAEGAIIYSAPETLPDEVRDPNVPTEQTPKIDVYSYGVLLCEVITCKLPDKFKQMKAEVEHSWPFMHSLITSCTSRYPDDRPTMDQVLSELKKLP